MKKIILPILLFCATLSINAQEYLHINSHWYENYIPIEEIDSISYGELSYQQMLPAIMAKDPSISLFNQALELTHLSDSLLEEYDYSYQEAEGQMYPGRASLQTYRFCGLSKIIKGYTAFVEPDSVYAEHGILTIDDLKAYAASVYNEMYPEDASISDPTDRRNSLNRFVSYHLLPIKAHEQNLTVANIIDRNGREMRSNYVSGYDISDWHETMMPHSLIKCSTPYNKSSVFINRRAMGESPVRDIFVKGAEIIYSGTALNGYYHYIDDIIAYDKQTQTVVLDEQIIVNNTTLSPEFMNNLRLTLPSLNSAAYQYGVIIHNNTFKNIKVHSDHTQMYYMFNPNWNNYQTDEMLVTGYYDFSIKLPPLPAGTYELNIGYNESSLRGVFECYFDEEFCDTIDLRGSSYNEKVTCWVSDEDLGTPAAIAQNDSLLFANGYRKGLEYYCTRGTTTTMRNTIFCKRAIITTFTTDGKSDHYLRFKNAVTSGDSEFHLDYLELCPTHLLKEYK